MCELEDELSFDACAGFAVTGHADILSRSRIFVSEVLPDGLAFSEGTASWIDYMLVF